MWNPRQEVLERADSHVPWLWRGARQRSQCRTLHLAESTSNVPWGTGEHPLLRRRERLGRADLYGSVSDGNAASRLAEPRTPRALAGGVSACLQPEERWAEHRRRFV